MPSSQHFVGGLFHDLGAGIEVLVNPCAKAHQPERIVLVLARAIYSSIRSTVPISSQHFHHGFVRAAVGGTPQCRDARRDARKGIAPARSPPDDTVRSRRSVHGRRGAGRCGPWPSQIGRRTLVVSQGLPEHHVQEVGA